METTVILFYGGLDNKILRSQYNIKACLMTYLSNLILMLSKSGVGLLSKFLRDQQFGMGWFGKGLERGC